MNFKFLDWNIQGKRYFTVTKPEKVFPVIKNLNPDIICLQEADKLAVVSEYTIIRSQSKKCTNVILSRFPVITKGELIFPKLSWRQLENAVWADIRIQSATLRIYNCHFGIVGFGPRQRAEQLKFVFEHAQNFNGPIIICGDFNTTIPERGWRRLWTQIFHLEGNSTMNVDGRSFVTDERYALAEWALGHGFKEELDLNRTTWCINLFGSSYEVFNLKLDWFLTKNIKTADLKLGPYISDHRYIYAECQL